MNKYKTKPRSCFHDALLTAGIPNDFPENMTGKECVAACEKLGLSVQSNCNVHVSPETPVIVFYDCGYGIGHAEYHESASEILRGFKLIGLIVDPLAQFAGA